VLKYRKETVSKVYFNRKEHKGYAKDAKSKYFNNILCDLCVNSLRPLRLMDLIFETASFRFIISDTGCEVIDYLFVQ